MSDFSRQFDVESLVNWVNSNPGNTISTLFDRWVLPGEPATEDRSLRVAIRSKCLNFYRCGQSVGLLRINRGGQPSLELHNKYVTGLNRIEGHGISWSQASVIFDAQTLADINTAKLIDGWITTAASYALPEKFLVEDLVASTPGVIDLEMGLPASKEADGSRSAPRMDIVAVQNVGGRFQIAFWEAKCGTNTELRARADYAELADGKLIGPKVLHQLHKYVRWMGGMDRVKQVQDAYVETAKILSSLQSHFRSDYAGESAEIWAQLAKAEATEVQLVLTPGVVIGNYLPAGSEGRSITCDALARSAKTFVENGHRAKLENNEHLKVFVFEVDAPGTTLPFLG